MSGRFRRSTLLVFAVAMIFSRSGVAGLAEGLEALKKGDYVTASRELRPVAERGDAEAQYRLGLMYEFGKGVAVDKAQSMAWLGRAAARTCFRRARARRDLRDRRRRAARQRQGSGLVPQGGHAGKCDSPVQPGTDVRERKRRAQG